MHLAALPRPAYPFLKWAGGKGQLLAQLEAFFPLALISGGIRRYVEPFIGSGAVFFRILQSYPVEECLITDSNLDLILTYQTIQQDVEGLIEALGEIEANYLNRTGYNGLFRLNSRGEFNVPFGRYKKPAYPGCGKPSCRRPLVERCPDRI